MTVVTYFTLRETCPPTLLVRKAERRRKETGDDRWYAPLETVDVKMGEKMQNILVKPWQIFFREPILICLHVYVAVSFAAGFIAPLFCCEVDVSHRPLGSTLTLAMTVPIRSPLSQI